MSDPHYALPLQRHARVIKLNFRLEIIIRYSSDEIDPVWSIYFGYLLLTPQLSIPGLQHAARDVANVPTR